MPRSQDRATQAAGWLARGALLLGSVTLALRFGLPAADHALGGALAGAAEDDAFGEHSGQGRPATPPSRNSRLARHETDDMSGRVMLKLIVLLFSVVALMASLMVGLHRLFDVQDARPNATLTAEQQVQAPPPKPNLQAAPMSEIASLHAAESRLLDNYAWIDAAHARGRIPIGRATALILGRPLDTAP